MFLFLYLSVFPKHLYNKLFFLKVHEKGWEVIVKLKNSVNFKINGFCQNYALLARGRPNLTPQICRRLCSLILCPGVMVEMSRIRGSFNQEQMFSLSTSFRGFISCLENCCIKMVNLTGEVKEYSQSVKQF